MTEVTEAEAMRVGYQAQSGTIRPSVPSLFTGLSAHATAQRDVAFPTCLLFPLFSLSLLVMFQWSLLNQAAPIFLLLLWFDASIGVHAMNTTIDDADSRIRYSDHWNVGGHCNE